MPIKKYPEAAAAGPAEAIASGAAFPAGASEGDVFYRTDLDAFYVYDGASWVEWEIETHVTEHEAGGADELTHNNLTLGAGDHHVKTGDNEVFGLVLYDTAANRPAAGIAGRWFISTDTLEISYDDGAAWNRVGVLGGLDLTTHGGRHKDGGADELDAADLAGALGAADQVLTSDGAAASWAAAPGGLALEAHPSAWNRVGLTNTGPLSDFGPWNKSADNPILAPGAASAWDDNWIRDPSIIRIGDTWYLFYTGHDGSTYRIGYASGTDLAALTKSADNPILDIGAASAWDDYYVAAPSVVKVGDTWYVFYAGYDGTNYRIGYAYGTDLAALTKSADNPIFGLGAASAWDDDDVRDPSVIRIGDIWYVFYTGFDGSTYKIGYASGKRLSLLAKSADNPILSIGGASAWDDQNVRYPSITRIGDTWYLFYGAYDGSTWRIGYASGTDLASLNKSLDNPVLDIGAASAWDDSDVRDSSIIRIGNTWYLFYGGYDGTNFKLGYATLPMTL